MIVSAIGLGALSVAVGPGVHPNPDAGAVEVPPGSEFNRAREDRQADLPAADRDAPKSDAAPRVAPAAPDDLSSLESADTAPAAAPETGTPDPAMTTPLRDEDNVGVAPAGKQDAPATGTRQTPAPDLPEAERDLAISTEPSQPPAPDPVIGGNSFATAPADDAAPNMPQPASDADAASDRSAGSTAEAPAAEATNIAPPTALSESGTLSGFGATADATARDDGSPDTGSTYDPAPRSVAPDRNATATTPEATAEPGARAASEPRALDAGSGRPGNGVDGGTIGDRATDVTTDRLPSVGDASGAAATDSGTITAADPKPDAAAPPAALQANALPFEAPAGHPLMAVVLIDDASSPFGPEALEGFPQPLSLAVNAAGPDAEQRARAYRAAGFEVLAMVDLPAAARAADVETAMQSALSAVPGAVAVIEGNGTGLQTRRAAGMQLAPILRETGHGLVLRPTGLDTLRKLIAREGVPAATLFRDIDGAGQDVATIRRALDQAALRAAQRGEGTIVAGRLRPDTISALLLWALQDRGARVKLAPVSALLRRQAEI
mgnify:CR=1 FL=1